MSQLIYLYWIYVCIYSRIYSRSVFSCQCSKVPFRELSGDGEIRTLDPLLARQVLSQLSYIPKCSGALLFSRAVSSKVPSAVQGLTVVFDMGTGVSPARIDTKTLSAVLDL